MKEESEIGVAELRNSLSLHLRAVKRGIAVIILDHGHPVARLVPYEKMPALRIREPAIDHRAVKLSPPPRKKLDLEKTLDEVREDRT